MDNKNTRMIRKQKRTQESRFSAAVPPVVAVSAANLKVANPKGKKKKSLAPVGFQRTTFETDRRCSANWATRPDGSWSWLTKMVVIGLEHVSDEVTNKAANRTKI